ncbi:MAG TPA: right-handed parallel beta-helix repeat-containing protein, partial [Polyangia bacterium]|nr:right-handed parallel beta-helix repeat-containing protein [Polyangia bacterium]
TAVTAIGVGQNPSKGTAGRYSAMISPTGGEQFIAPASLRLVGAAYDPFVYNNTPVEGKGGNAMAVQFYVDDTMVLTVAGTDAEFWVFKGFTSGIGAGQHRVWCRAIFATPSEQLDSPPMIINVSDPPTYANTVDLTADVTVDSSGYSLVGTANGRVRLNGHGHKIAATSTSGPLTLQFVDVFDMGNESDTSMSGIDVTTTGTVTIEDSNFDSSNTVSLSLGGSATASIQRNTFRSNMRQPLGQYPYSPTSYPALAIAGASTGSKVLAGNRAAAGWFNFDKVQNWLVGGDTDADSNVLIGVRVGLQFSGSSNVQVRRNYTHHNYYGGWSEGANYELYGSPTMLVEHNVIYGSSWPVRGAGCEFRYNAVLDAGHEWLWPEPNGNIHHNLFVGGSNDVGGIWIRDPYTGVQFYNNTLDGFEGWVAAVELDMGAMSVTSNAFVNVPDGPTIHINGGTLTAADYNAFDNKAGGNYSDGRTPAHDKIGDEKLAMPAMRFFLDESTIWTGQTTVSGVLGLYRMHYTPQAGSTLIDAGDPAGGAGNDIGAVGAGTPNANDKFGLP